jgi:hypothetical protein
MGVPRDRKKVFLFCGASPFLWGEPFFVGGGPKRGRPAKKNKTKQNKTKQNKTKQNKTKQNKTKQNKTKQNKTKQNKQKKTFFFFGKRAKEEYVTRKRDIVYFTFAIAKRASV